MAKNTSVNLDITRGVNGYTIAGGSTKVVSAEFVASTTADAVVFTTGYTGSQALALPASASGTLALVSQIPSLLSWSDVAGTTQALVANNGYRSQSASASTFTLPASAAQFTVIKVLMDAAGLVKIAQNALQNVRFGSSISTTGTGGYIEATLQGDYVELLCTVANTSWVVVGAVGSWTIV